jgi:UDP-N-acetylmuramyl pentapeptide phosphotransferase/UDP-N-acetylglucosamine-1-phosphate transferase
MATSSLQQLAPAVIVLAAALISAALIIVLKPLLARYALARPNARSSHVVPTPQGGGIAVIAALFVAASPALIMLASSDQQTQAWILFAAVAFLAVVGAIDDIRTIEVAPRLVMQFIAVGVVVALLPNDIHIVPILPLWLERTLLVLAGVWFVNLANFMDGIDWMTATEVIAIAIGLLLLALIGVLPVGPAIIALALLGAIIGFAPFNRPVAKLFLGDVGSLPIGLLLFWLLVQLAGRGQLAAALLLPLYYLADATTTLVMRVIRGESILQAHRGHFYQQATNVGWSVPEIIARVALGNALLVMLALASAWVSLASAQIIALAAGIAVVALLLRQLTQGKR